MRVKIYYRGQIKELEFSTDKVRAIDIIKALGLSTEYAFLIRGEEVLQDTDIIKDKEELRLINALSGG